jgi:hypothetical protein
MPRLASVIVAAVLMLAANLAVATGRAGTVVLQVDLSAQPQGQEARLWVPYPVTDRHQTIADIRVAGDFASSGLYTDREHGTPILYAEWPKEAASRKLSLSFSVEREEVVRGELPATEPAWKTPTALSSRRAGTSF